MRTLLSVGCAALAVAGAIAGCSSGGHAADSNTITIMAPFLSTTPPGKNNPIGQALQKLTGKKINITWAPNSSYEDKTNITLAGDNIPQIMVVQGKTAGFVKNAQAGAFWDLTDKLKDYPNLVTTTPQIQQNASINGKVYGIYRARDAMRASVMVRKDWLAKLHMSLPKNTADLYNLAKAFTNNDPDGDGKKDTYGIVIPQWPGALGSESPYDVIETWFGAGNLWTKRGGKLVPGFETPQFMQADQYIQKMVKEGLINKDFATMDSVKWNEPFFDGKAGIIIDEYSRVGQLETLFEQKYPKTYDKYIAFTGNLAGPDGNTYAYPTDGYSGFLAIPKASVRTEAQLKTVLSFLNKLNTKPAQILMNNGIAGKNFTVQDGQAVAMKATPSVTTLNDEVAAYAQLGTNVNGYKAYEAKQPNAYDQQQYARRLKLEAADLKRAVYNPAAPYVSQTYITNGAQLDNIVSDARIKFIAGQIDEKGFKNAVNLWEKSGGSKVKQEINKLYSEHK